MPKSFAVIINIGSGALRTETRVQQVRNAFASHHTQPEIFLAHDGGAILAATQKALEAGYSVVVAAGGDGTINAVAAEVIRARGVLGILPLGTLNHLAKDLGIPVDIQKAVNVLVAGHQETIDAVRVNNRIFINNSSIGLYPKLLALREIYKRRGAGKWTALLAAALRVFRWYAYVKVRIEIKGRDMYIRTPFVFVGNNKYEVEGMKLGTRLRINNQELSLYVMHHTSRWGLVVLAWRALFGGLSEHRDFDVYSVKKARIDTKKKFIHVSLDGELATLSTPLEYHILPGALTVITPQK